MLDDVLIGLDLANRIPVLKILSEEFADWQIILMTYDPVWFDLAREYTEHTGRWTTLNLRELPTTAGQPGRPHVEPGPDLLAVAEKHLQARDLMACVAYLRACFETRLKKVCCKHHIRISYEPNPRMVTANDLWQGIVEYQKERQERGKDDFIEPTLMQDVEMVRSTVLNRVLHSGIAGVTTTEVQRALEIMRRFQHCQFKKI